MATQKVCYNTPCGLIKSENTSVQQYLGIQRGYIQTKEMKWRCLRGPRRTFRLLLPQGNLYSVGRYDLGDNQLIKFLCIFSLPFSETNSFFIFRSLELYEGSLFVEWSVVYIGTNLGYMQHFDCFLFHFFCGIEKTAIVIFCLRCLPCRINNMILY